MDRWLQSALDYIPEWLGYQSHMSKRPGCVIAIAHRGRIILEPQVSIPASEAWLFRNKRALESVARGLDQIADAKVIGSFAEYVDDEP